ncbi:transposase [Candidatus Epulonipiscioides saccharophilum]|nr:transposase [Epulopiscium sp. SCG-B10WGA-EpuloB]
MDLTIKIKLIPTNEEKNILTKMCNEFIKTINTLAEKMYNCGEIIKLTTAKFQADLPSAVKNQCIREAKSIYSKYLKGVTEKLAVLKKQVCVWNNQNYTIEENTISFPVWLEKSKKISIKTIIPQRSKELLQNNRGTLRISKKNNKYIAQVTIKIEKPENYGENIMGVDLGIKVPAVCVTTNGKVKFIGNGRENKVIRRKFKAKRKKLGKLKKPKAIKKINNKENRIMQDRDHKYSKEIIEFAKKNNVSIIKLEQLANIRNTTRKSRKNDNSLHNWSFYRLSKFIEYKAKLAGIKVEYVNPAYTSQICPICSEKNKAKDRLYRCRCGYTRHRDLVGAINISRASGIS